MITKRLVTLATKHGGELDEFKGTFYASEDRRLVKQEVISNNSNLTSLKCSPSGEKCLTGNSSEKLIDVVNKEEFTWLQIKP